MTTNDGINMFWEYCQNNNFKLGLYPEINPDGIAFVGITNGSNNIKILENISTKDIDLKKINGGKWVEMANKLSNNTLEKANEVILMELALYGIRNAIDIEIATLIYDQEGNGRLVGIPPDHFSLILTKKE